MVKNALFKTQVARRRQRQVSVLAASPGVNDELAPEQVLDLNQPQRHSAWHGVSFAFGSGQLHCCLLSLDEACRWLAHVATFSESKHMNWDEG